MPLATVRSVHWFRCCMLSPVFCWSYWYCLIYIVARTCCLFHYLEVLEVGPSFAETCHHCRRVHSYVIFILSLSCTFGKNCFVIVALVHSFHSFCHFLFVSFSISLISVPLEIFLFYFLLLTFSMLHYMVILHALGFKFHNMITCNIYNLCTISSIFYRCRKFTFGFLCITCCFLIFYQLHCLLINILTKISDY